MKKIPILLHHDPMRPVGFIEVTDWGLAFRFSEEMIITREMIFNIFGNVGFEATELAALDNGQIRIIAGTILEFSLE